MSGEGEGRPRLRRPPELLAPQCDKLRSRGRFMFMRARTSPLRPLLATICGAALACGIGCPEPVARCDPDINRSQTEVHPAPRDLGRGNPVLQLPAKSSRAVPALRPQGAADPQTQRAVRSQNALEVPRVNQMSQRMLGCWSGDTAPAPVNWQVVSPAGAYLAYSRDRIRLCLSDVNGELRVGYADAEDAEPAQHPYGIVYRPVRAIGKQVDLELKSWDPDSRVAYRETGTARCVLNADDTISYSHSITTFLAGKPAVKAETRADLKREH